MFLAKWPRFAFSLTHHSNSFRSLGRPFLTKSLKRARRVTSEFHRINNKLGFAETSEDGAKIERKKGVGEAFCGGVTKARGTNGIPGSLRAYDYSASYKQVGLCNNYPARPPSDNERHPLSLLEIGAVNTQLLPFLGWKFVRSIFRCAKQRYVFQNLLNADHMRAELLHCAGQTPKNEQTDFFDLKPASCYDAGFLPWYHETKPQTPRNLQQISLKTSSGPKLPPQSFPARTNASAYSRAFEIGGHRLLWYYITFKCGLALLINHSHSIYRFRDDA